MVHWLLDKSKHRTSATPGYSTYEACQSTPEGNLVNDYWISSYKQQRFDDFPGNVGASREDCSTCGLVGIHLMTHGVTTIISLNLCSRSAFNSALWPCILKRQNFKKNNFSDYDTYTSTSHWPDLTYIKCFVCSLSDHLKNINPQHHLVNMLLRSIWWQL